MSDLCVLTEMKIKESPVIQQLIKWEDLNAEEYLRELDRDERETLEYRVKQTEKNTSDILTAIVDPMTGERGSLAERVSHLESQVSACHVLHDLKQNIQIENEQDAR